MPITFACPGCGKRFKVDDDKAGRKGKCPACAVLFEIPAPAAPRRAVAADEDAPPRRRPARPADDDDDRAQARRDPDDRPRRRPADDYADDDYDEEEERPRRRKKKKKKKSSTGLIVGLVGGAVGLLLLIGGLVWAIVSLSGEATVADDLKYMPDNPGAIAVFHFSKFRTSDLYKRLRAESTFFEKLIQQTGGQVEDLENGDRATYGYNLADNSFVAVIRSKRAINLEAEATRTTRKYNQEEEFGGHKVRHDGFQAIAAPERKTLLMGPVLMVKKVLERRGAKATLSPALQAAFQELDLTKHLAMAADFQAAAAARDQPGGVPFMPNPNQAAPPDSMLMYLDAGATLTGGLTFNCKSDQDAQNLKKQIETGLAMFKGPIPIPGMPREVADALKNVQVAATGSRATITLSLDNNSVIELAKKMPALPLP